MSCCPPGSAGPAPFLSEQQVPKGQVVDITVQQDGALDSDLPPPTTGYWTGVSIASLSKKNCKVRRVAIVFTDVFGIESGNHKVFADALAQELGDDTVVLIPDMFRGNPIMQPFTWLPDSVSLSLAFPAMVFRLKFQNPPARIENDITKLIVPWIESKISQCQNTMSAISWSCVGFCFGGWVTGHALALSNSEELPFSCGVGVHPSFKPEELHGGSQVALAEMIGSKPYLLLPGSNDDDVKADSSVVDVMAKARGVSNDEVAVEFPTVKHGRVSRGDSRNEEVANQQKAALRLTVDFIKKNS